MYIVLITRDRPELTVQTLKSMRDNAADWSRHSRLVVFDGTDAEYSAFVQQCRHVSRYMYGAGQDEFGRFYLPEMMSTGKQLGVGGAKNFGAFMHEQLAMTENQRPKAESLVMFSDNDMYYLPGWDERLEQAISVSSVMTDNGPVTQLGGWRHPFHAMGPALISKEGWLDNVGDVRAVDAVTGNCFVMRWADWLKYGPFDANALGPGQSEDYALSRKIAEAGGVVATLDPPVAIHCGLVNCLGEPAVGWRECETLITRQLASLPEKLRDEVLVMRPAMGGAHGGQKNGGDAYPEKDQAGSQYRMLDLAGTENQQRVRSDINISTPESDSSSSPSRSLGIQKIQSEQSAAGAASLRREAVLQPESSFRGHATDQHTRYVGKRQAGEDVQLSKEIDGSGRGSNPPSICERSLHESKSCRRMGTGQVYCSVDCFRKDLGIGLTVPLKINCGSGQRRFDNAHGWVNIDSQSVPPDRVPDMQLDASKEGALPGGADYVVLHHVLEHFGCGEADALVRNCWAALRSGGSLLVFVPDLRKLAARWLGGELDHFLFLVNVYGAYMGDEADRHRWGFDRWSLTEYLSRLTHSDADACDGHIDRFEPRCGHCNDNTRDFDWREISGADIARDFWIAAVEVVKP